MEDAFWFILLLLLFFLESCLEEILKYFLFIVLWSRKNKVDTLCTL